MAAIAFDLHPYPTRHPMATRTASAQAPQSTTLPLPPADILHDYRLAVRSRQASLVGRKEVLTGKAKFGIFGDGKELPQLAMARAARPGDFRSGYYRDQTFMFATGLATVQQFFAQLYAHPDLAHDPFSAGRQMNAHFATRLLDDQGRWTDATQTVQTAADLSPTASQMPKTLGLAQASKLYRNLPELAPHAQLFSQNGNEVVFATIGDASTSEGLFWETVNAAGVLQVPVVFNVWDDNYGISVPIRYQTTKQSISEVLAGFAPTADKPGVRIITVKAWDYPALLATYAEAAAYARHNHAPVLIHVQECTQPQGHSTSGSHERYKTKERLKWEAEFDGIAKLREWILAHNVADAATLDAIDDEEKKHVAQARKDALAAVTAPLKAEIAQVTGLLDALAAHSATGSAAVRAAADELRKALDPIRRDIYVAIRKALIATANDAPAIRQPLLDWKAQADRANADRYNSHLYSENDGAALRVPAIAPTYAPTPEQRDGREILQACFDANFARDPRILAFGEDLGYLGDVNQAFAGLQEKYGEARVGDTGIREATIIGQGLGLAMRGLRPIAEIQYLDYLLYALQLLSDDVATLRYRTRAGQQAPLIVRTRGHRLEGVWHSGSPMGTILHALRGMYVCVPRDMTRAAGFYNTLLRGNDPALVVEVLNGYRLKEAMPTNIADYCLPLGVPEVIRTGQHITVVTYGANCRLALDAADILATLGVELEVVDVQTLLPFDTTGQIAQSLRKTSRLICFDEDVPGGASAYMLQQILEVQNGYRYLDSAPRTLTAQAHRPAYASDGDYFSKPTVEDLISLSLDLMAEFDPARYRNIWKG